MPATTTAEWVRQHDPLTIVTGASKPDARHPITGAYVETYWTPLVGPAVIATARRLQGFADVSADPIAHATLAAELGVKPARIEAILTRLIRFGFGEARPEALAVFPFVRRLSSNHLDRLPRHLRDRHEHVYGSVR